MATYIAFSKITGVLMLMMIAQIVSSAHAQIGKIPSLQGDAMEAKHLGLVVGQLLAENLVECYVVAILSGKESSFQRSLREVLHDSASKGVVYLDGKHLSDNDQRPFAAKALDTLKPRFTCRAIVMDVLASALTEDIFRFLEDVKLYLHPDTYIVLAGSRDKLTELILQNTFRNTVNILYLGIGEEVIFDSQNIRQESNKSKVVEVFTRCFYCDGGEAKVYSLGIWNPRASPHIGAQLFKDQFRNFYGHKFRIVCMAWFPYTDFARTSKQGGTIVYPLDSLDVRMLKGIAKALNFSYEMRVPWDNQWGTSTANGNWTGIVGTLQHHKGDFSMMLSWLENRLPVVDYSRVYSSEPLVMVTAKSAPLPQSFALVRPFTPQLWGLTVLSTVVAGVTLWILQKIWSRISNERSIGLGSSVLLTWAIILEDPPMKLPKNITAQMLIGWWWLYCMQVTIMYRSSLIAHLTVPGKSPELNSLDDLLEANKRQKWTWGFEPTYGSGWEWLKLNENPTVREIFKGIEVLELDEQLRRVLSSRHAFITWKYYIRSIILSQYTDERGYTPIHTAKEEFFNYGGYGWGFRKGAPFRGRIDIMKLRLIESGAIKFWMNKLIESSAAKSRSKKKKNSENEDEAEEKRNNDQRRFNTVLGMGHLQGVFYILIMGNVLGLLSFLFECCSSFSSPKLFR